MIGLTGFSPLTAPKKMSALRAHCAQRVVCGACGLCVCAESLCGTQIPERSPESHTIPKISVGRCTSPVLSSAGRRRHWQISLEPFREGAFERDQRCGWRRNLADGFGGWTWFATARPLPSTCSRCLNFTRKASEAQ